MTPSCSPPAQNRSGSRCRRQLPHVHVLRSLADGRAIIAAAGGTRRAAVIGSSFIGLEVAAALRHRGLEVDVVGRDALPLGRALGEALGRFVKSVHEEHGVRFHLSASPRAIRPGQVELDSGEVVAADLVVMGVGVRPGPRSPRRRACACRMAWWWTR